MTAIDGQAEAVAEIIDGMGVGVSVQELESTVQITDCRIGREVRLNSRNFISKAALWATRTASWT